MGATASVLGGKHAALQSPQPDPVRSLSYGGIRANPDHASDLSKTRLAVAQGAEIA